MYFTIIQQFARTLKNLDGMLDKSIQFAEQKKFDPNNFCTLRLAPDMFPFTKQIQVCCDVAKACASSFSGKPPVSHEDNETTMADLKARIRKTLNYLETMKEEDFKNINPKLIVPIPFPKGKAMYAEEALVSRAIPNFYFHVGMAYAILRSNGVDVGKTDYLGQLNIMDAPAR